MVVKKNSLYHKRTVADILVSVAPKLFQFDLNSVSLVANLVLTCKYYRYLLPNRTEIATKLFLFSYRKHPYTH